ncbi:phospholipase A [Ramlibacter sp. USB13]|uniref:Phospholipase A1 n=1 Tax=Ramlibacter cellulosilyticus TaxID=2764187 RepID=A0A923MTW6_9BURK|nr:phospholipase A [Ramlibacter cellulosilyticus]MBC5784099.1 phospholipase A [Ramlibacter cellulosilyticus]
MHRTLTSLAAFALPLLAHAQAGDAWQACTALADKDQRLACFDAWAKQQAPAAATAAPAATTPPPPPEELAQPPLPVVPRRGFTLTSSDDCHDPQYSELTRFWELAPGADCGTFGIRGYRPISIAVATANTVNRQPTSENPNNNATAVTDYRTTEARLQLSVRTKVAQGLFSYGERGMDSLWLAYTQLSYWQVFTPALSRPFRNTDHEPEILYVTPIQRAQPGEWRLRLGGVGLVHQSNGQSLPLSRSWNRVYLMAGAERNDVQVHARLWNRIDEGNNDDNPRISDYVGRGEVAVRWNADRRNLWALTGRHGLKSGSHGSLRLEWFHTLADPGFGLPGGLRLHTQLFSGYGDTLIDYNKSRTVFSIGFSLVEW